MSHAYPVDQVINNPRHRCIYPWLVDHTKRSPHAPAILAPQRTVLTYRRLREHVDEVVHTLHAMGLGRHDRIALVLPNSSEMALAFLAVAVCATCAPLNPAYSPNEFEFYLTDLRAKALIIQADMDSPARAVAKAHGISIIELSPRLEAEAGLFTLSGKARASAVSQEYAQPADVALVLHTSGTVSKPKVVPLTHINLCIASHNMRVAFELAESDRCLNVLPFFHLHALQTVILTSLVAGASMVCPSRFSTPQFFAWLEEFRPTWYTAVPTIHQEIVESAVHDRKTFRNSSLRLIRSGSAALPGWVRLALEETFRVPVIETYGATEASGHITCNPPPSGKRKADSVGAPVGSEVAIMDEAGNFLPIGRRGEIVVRGVTVMQGYDNDPMANRIAFTRGWLRLGDEGYVDTDGYLFVTGRIKEIINRGGLKISPQEVDDVLREHVAVAQAATFAVPHERWGEDVASAVVLKQNAAVTEQELRQFVATRLTAYKVPSQVRIVERIPVGPTGKVQRHLLADLMSRTRRVPVPSVYQSSDTAARTPIEEILAGIWATVLDLECVGVDDNFFQLGGDSLVTIRLLSRIRETTHVDLPFRSFFEAPTIATIAKHIATAQQAAPQPLEPPLHAIPRHAPLPLSYHQQRLWFLEELRRSQHANTLLDAIPLYRPPQVTALEQSPLEIVSRHDVSRHAYNLLDALRLHGPLHMPALEQSFQDVIRRHEILRTTFRQIAGEPRQVIGQAPNLPMSVKDLRHLAQHEREAQVHVLARAEVQQSFDMERGPLMRVTVLRLSQIDHVLLLTMHHIVSDGWSQGILWQELAWLYEAFIAGRPAPLTAFTIQYADFASWQQQWLQGPVVSTQLAYWKRQLQGAPTLRLPTDYPRPDVQTFRGAREFLMLSSSLTHEIKMLSQRHGVTLFMTLLAAFKTLLHRYSGQDDIVVGSLIANRNRVEFERLIGFFVNTVVMRTDLSGDPSFQDLLTRVRDVTLGAYGNKDVPYEKVLAALRPPRAFSRNPLFQVMCVLHNTPQQVLELPGITVHPLEIDPGAARFDVTLDLWETKEGVRCRFEYSTDLFEAATIARMAGHLQTLLESIVAEPEQRLSQLPLLTVDERQHVLVEWNTTAAPYPDTQCIHSIFAYQATRTPDAVAVVSNDASLTYRELNHRANQVAHYLRTLGVETERLIGLYLERSLDLVIGLLGILKAGAAYMPLDPTSSPEHLAFILGDAKPSVVLTEDRFVPTLPVHGTQIVCLDTHWSSIAQHSDHNPVCETTADNLAYQLYTSGSTGRPKGVLGTHRATLNVLAWLWKSYPFARGDVCCHHISTTFVDSIQELLSPLLQGVTVVLIPGPSSQGLSRFVQTLAVHRVTRLILAPSLLRVLLDAYSDLQDRLPRLKLWFSGGEVLSIDLCHRFRACVPSGRLINLYGASEASANTTSYDISMAPQQLACVPIGRPIANTQVYVLDTTLQPVPVGVAGELYVGGAGLARGYHNRPGLTAERFIPNPFGEESGARLYKTGDLVRYRPDGNIEYLGRRDRQMKLLGIRIELEGIEAALMQHPGVRQTAVVPREDVSGESRLVAYIIPAQQPGPPLRELRRFLERKFSDAMVPTAFVMLDTLPLTPSGKVDHQALPEPGSLRPGLEDRYVAPQNSHEQHIAAIWRELLGLDRVGIHDNFFELGGHSLLAMRLLFRVEEATQVQIPLVSFFAAPTVLSMVRLIEAASRMERRDGHAPAIVPLPRDGVLPASIAQEHFWFLHQKLPDLPLLSAFDMPTLPHKGAFNISYGIRLRGSLHVAALGQSMHEVIRRHQALRTTFAYVDDHLIQIIMPTSSISLNGEDLRGLPKSDRACEARRRMQEEGQRPFNLTRGPLLRAHLLWVDDHEHILLVTLHHIICDGVSLGLFMRELFVLYNAFAAGEPSPLAELPVQYADFAYWQRQWQHHAGMQSQLAYWGEQLRGPLPALALPLDRPPDPAFLLPTARSTVVFPGDLCEVLKELSQGEGHTLFITCLAALKILLYSYTGETDLRIGTLVANRTSRVTEGLIGLLTNTVILRTDLSGNPTLREVRRRVHMATLTAFAHQDLPFEEVIRVLERDRDIDRSSLCQVMVIWQSNMVQPQQWPQQTLRFEAIEQNAGVPEADLSSFDLILTLREKPDGMIGTAIYKTSLFQAEIINQMLADLQHVLTTLRTQSEQTLTSFRAWWERRA